MAKKKTDIIIESIQQRKPVIEQVYSLPRPIISNPLDFSDKKYVEIPLQNGHSECEIDAYLDIPKGYANLTNIRDYEFNGLAPIPEAIQDVEHLGGNPTGVYIDSSAEMIGAANGSGGVPIVLTGTVDGTVTNSVTSSPIENVTVSLAAETRSTGGTGGYVFSGIAEGTKSITGSKLGYADYSGSVAVAPGVTTTKDFALTPDAGFVKTDGTPPVPNPLHVYGYTTLGSWEDVYGTMTWTPLLDQSEIDTAMVQCPIRYGLPVDHELGLGYYPASVPMEWVEEGYTINDPVYTDIQIAPVAASILLNINDPEGGLINTSQDMTFGETSTVSLLLFHDTGQLLFVYSDASNKYLTFSA